MKRDKVIPTNAVEDEQIHELERRILKALESRQMPIRLNQAEVIIDIKIFAKAMARDYFSPCRWVQGTARKHLKTLKVNVEN